MNAKFLWPFFLLLGDCLFTISATAKTEGLILDPQTLRPILAWDGKTLRNPRTHLAEYHWDGGAILQHGNRKLLYVWRKGWLHDSRSHLPLYGIDRENHFVQARTWKRLFEYRKGLIRTSRTLKRVYLVEGSFPPPLLLAFTTGLIGEKPSR